MQVKVEMNGYLKYRLHIYRSGSRGLLMRTTPARSRSDSSAKQIESITTQQKNKRSKDSSLLTLRRGFPFLYLHTQQAKLRRLWDRKTKRKKKKKNDGRLLLFNTVLVFSQPSNKGQAKRYEPIGSSRFRTVGNNRTYSSCKELSMLC